MIRVAAAFAIALALSLYTTPLMRQAAIKFGIVDKPDGSLKKHGTPVPYLGGLAVFSAYLISLAVTFEFGLSVLGILLSGTLMLLVGLIDDLGVLSPWEKLLGQVIAVGALLKAGLYIKLVFLPESVALFLSVFWLLSVTNAVNIIDIMDGLAPGVSAIAAFFLAAIAIHNGEPMVAAMAASLSGALFGFLAYNFRPARIYLGDSGSLFIGLTLAALAMNGHYTTKNDVGLLVPVMVLGVPLLDLAFVFVARILKGRSPFRGSADHLALRLRRLGWSIERTVGMAYVIGAVLGLTASVVMEFTNGMAASMLVFIAAATLLISIVALWRKEA